MMDNHLGNSFHHSRHLQSAASHGPSAIGTSSTAQPLLPPPSALQALPSISRTLPEPHLHPPTTTRSPVGFPCSDARYHPYAASSGSPSSVSGTIPEANDHYGQAVISPTQGTAPNLGATKRAYRQRRKDPSCDACRERKVKCDATETTSCSECSSRGVKCQFTKETNRRMSSIKQVQDLQAQLTEARSENIRLRAMLDASRSQQTTASSVPIESRPITRDQQLVHPEPILQGFSHIHRNFRKYSRGVFKLPPPYRETTLVPFINSAEPALPPPDLVSELLATYYGQMHRQNPMIHWDEFIQQWEKARAARNFIGAPQTWVALFFIVLACGTLQNNTSAKSDVEGMRYYVIAARLMNTWTDNLQVDHARTALLISIFLYEQNTRSAAWVWLGTAIRITEDIGLEHKAGSHPSREIEGRIRTYWAIVTWDRLLALQENKAYRPTVADEDDSWPKAVKDHWLKPQGVPRPPENPPTVETAGVVLRVVPFIGQIMQALTAPTIAADVLRYFEDVSSNLLSQYPEILQPHSDHPIEPFVFSSIIPLLMGRYHLYRHNITTLATAQERAEALERCYAVSLDTARYLERVMRQQPNGSGPQTWQEMLRMIVHNLMCRHVWRCTLILCLCGDFDAAKICIQFQKAIGETRRLNVACGRYLAFFLDQLTERIVSGVAQADLQSDLELLAYASGDLQGDLNAGFIWRGATPVLEASALTLNSSAMDEDDDEVRPSSALLTEKETTDWGGWERVEQQVWRLSDEQNRRRNSQYSVQPSSVNHSPLYHRPAHNETKRVQLGPSHDAVRPTESTGSGAAPSRNRSPPTGASRISIANII